MNYLEAKIAYTKQFHEGRNTGLNKPCKFPFSDRYANEKFIEVKLPLKEIRISAKYPELVSNYKTILSTLYMGPLWVSIGRKMADGAICVNYNKSFRLIDGNHRSAAYRKLGINSVRVILPESHYNYYKNNGAKIWQG